MKNFITAIGGVFKNLFTAVFGKNDTPVISLPQVNISQATVDHIITIVNNVKTVVENPVTIIITDLIPGTLDNTVVKLIDESIVPIMAGLTFVKSWISDPSNSNRDVLATDILNKVHFSDDPYKNSFYHSLAAHLIVAASDGKVTWSEAVSIIEIYFKNFFGLKQAA